ncbi:hypothetical protein IHE44_0011476 [Lamprotornis superbus]|uniref:Ankyrin repeat and death domain-containing protein 1B n=1 Tax=Lamprotornis superbus TaxID=245042 RepID=A0A835TTQ3_9PASS|nr:hypothetical protein IHE44_0011476 [Lamprotornis superbus]
MSFASLELSLRHQFHRESGPSFWEAHRNHRLSHTETQPSDGISSLQPAYQSVKEQTALLKRTAFHFAVAGGHVSVVDFLLHHKARLDMADQEGNTALHLAAKNGHSEVVEILLGQWEEINDLNQSGETPFYLAVEGGHEKCAELLLEAGSDINVSTQNNSNALQVAIQNGHLSLVTFLIDKNIDLVAKPEQKNSPLHLAIISNNLPVVKSLLDANHDINSLNHRQETPLHLAAELGNVELVEMLLKSGCNLRTMDKHGKTALATASRSHHALIVDMIIKAERYFAMKQTHRAHGSNGSDFSVSFKQDHNTQTKQIRSSLWNLAYNQLKPREWKKLAVFWKFTDEQIKAIEEQWTAEISRKNKRKQPRSCPDADRQRRHR